MYVSLPVLQWCVHVYMCVVRFSVHFVQIWSSDLCIWMGRRVGFAFPVIQPLSKVSAEFCCCCWQRLRQIKFEKKSISNSFTLSLLGTPPRGKRRVWFADEILTNQQSESAPTTPVRGPSFSPLMRRVLGGPVKSPVGSPQIRRTLRPHGTTISVGSPKQYCFR